MLHYHRVVAVPYETGTPTACSGTGAPTPCAQVGRVEERLAGRSIRLQLRPEAVDFLADRGFDPAFGARPVKRVVQRYLESGLAKVRFKD